MAAVEAVDAWCQLVYTHECRDPVLITKDIYTFGRSPGIYGCFKVVCTIAAMINLKFSKSLTKEKFELAPICVHDSVETKNTFTDCQLFYKMQNVIFPVPIIY